MRIIKLSNKDRDFATYGDVRSFFYEVVKHRKPPGRFRVTANKIKKDGLFHGEPLLFTYQARIVFTARTRSGLLPNDDEGHLKYPSFFVIDISTLEEADEDFYQIEKQLNEVTGKTSHLVRSQAWNPIPDSVHTHEVWHQLRKIERFILPEEIADPTGFPEGAISTLTVNAFERNPEARKLCLEHYGTCCAICGFDFSSTYGPAAEGFMHVHHLRSLSEIKTEHLVDPIRDLRPVCPNCHAVIHRRTPAYSLEEVKEFLMKGKD